MIFPWEPNFASKQFFFNDKVGDREYTDNIIWNTEGRKNITLAFVVHSFIFVEIATDRQVFLLNQKDAPRPAHIFTRIRTDWIVQVGITMEVETSRLWSDYWPYQNWPKFRPSFHF